MKMDCWSDWAAWALIVTVFSPGTWAIVFLYWVKKPEGCKSNDSET